MFETIFSNETFVTFLGILIPILATAVGTAIVAAASYFVQSVKKKIENEQFDKYLRILEDAVYDVVGKLNQTIVEKLKAAAVDGKLTREEIEDLGASALYDIKAILGSRGIEVLQTVYEDLNSLITTKVESVINERKLLTAC